MRLLTPAQAELDNKPDINDLLLLGQAALAHGAAGHTIAASTTGPLSQALLPQPSPSYLTAPSTAAVRQSLLTVAVAPAPQPPPLLPQHPVKIEATTGVPPAVSLLPQPPPPTPPAPVDPEHHLHQSEQDLKALSERMCMPPPPPPPPPPPAQRASPPSGVSSTSEELTVGTKKTAKASTTSTIANDRSDIGKKRRKEARHTYFCAFVSGKIKSAPILPAAHVDSICIYSVCVCVCARVCARESRAEPPSQAIYVNKLYHLPTSKLGLI